jgi:hypothetical protein
MTLRFEDPWFRGTWKHNRQFFGGCGTRQEASESRHDYCYGERTEPVATDPLSLEREEDERDLRKRIEALLDKSTPQQAELIHRLASVLIEP